jgi:hypothetical protein
MELAYIIFLIVVILTIITIFIYYEKEENKSNLPIRISESNCKQRENGTYKRRVTYRCDNLDGCIYNNKLRYGIFHEIEDCIHNDSKLLTETYKSSGPYYGYGNSHNIKNTEIMNEIKLLPVVIDDVCLSLETGHKITCQKEDEIGFTGIYINDVYMEKEPDVKISTKYKNDEDMLNYIKQMFEENKSSLISIDGKTVILQKCKKYGTDGVSFFNMKTSDKFLTLIDDKLSLDSKDNNTFFKFESIVKDGLGFTCILICYKNINNKGWIDNNLNFISGDIPPIGSENALKVYCTNEMKLYDFKYNKIKNLKITQGSGVDDDIMISKINNIYNYIDMDSKNEIVIY